MRNKNIGFLRKAGLCLCLMGGFGLFGCSIVKQGNRPVEELNTYCLTVFSPPGGDESALFPALDGAAIVSLDRLPLVQPGFAAQREQFKLSVSVSGEPAFQRLLSQLQSSGFWVKSSCLSNH